MDTSTATYSPACLFPPIHILALLRSVHISTSSLRHTVSIIIAFNIMGAGFEPHIPHASSIPPPTPPLTPPTPSNLPYIASTFKASDLLSTTASGLPVFVSPRIPDGISLRNFGIQVVSLFINKIQTAFSYPKILYSADYEI